ncbi:protein of unknown function [Candidatus Nitrosocosmicus franklandus]|uniref:Uncharacterized protein n=1 Tax=Candidatus Nitrosocosmicus franklandianus TaxID=1798806 RepID=A0A484IEY5_9ARCH|nr:protein of unknown function [Candidatus Nitrosocosmicus franklandus]
MGKSQPALFIIQKSCTKDVELDVMVFFGYNSYTLSKLFYQIFSFTLCRFMVVLISNPKKIRFICTKNDFSC